MKKEKLFLCFWVGDGGDSESNSVWYSELVEASSKKEALKKYFASGKAFASSNEENYGVKEIEKIIK